jgi:predicted  nucleic acid-binding Zn-ribbon protein
MVKRYYPVCCSDVWMEEDETKGGWVLYEDYQKLEQTIRLLNSEEENKRQTIRELRQKIDHLDRVIMSKDEEIYKLEKDVLHQARIGSARRK